VRSWLSLLLCLNCLPALADEYALEKQLIVGELAHDSLGVISFSHDEFAGKYQNISDFLQQQTGIQVRKSGIGNPVSISIRGSTHQQVKFIIDGHEVNDAQYGGFDLNKIPLHQIEQIQVIQGNSSSHTHGDAVGGTVLIQTLSTNQSSKNKLYTSISSFNTHNYGLTHYFKANGSGLISIENLSSDADYSYPVESPYSNPNNQNRTEDINNNQFYKTSALLKWQSNEIDRQSYGLKGLYISTEKHLPNYQQNPSENDSNISSDEWELQSFLSKSFYQDWISKSEITINSKHELYDDRYDWIGIGSDLNSYDTRNYQLKQSIDFKGNHYDLSSFLLLNTETFKDNHKLINDNVKCLEVISTCDLRSKQSTQKVGGNVTWYSPQSAHQVSTNVTFIRLNREQQDLFGEKEKTSSNNQHLSWNSQYSNRILENVYSTFTLGESIRIPTLYELFGDRGLLKSNTALKPEKSKNINTEITFTKKSFSFSNSFYYRALTDAIVADLPSGIGSYKNLSSAKVFGWQSRINLHYKQYRLAINWQLQDSLTESEISAFNDQKLSGIFHKSFSISTNYVISKNFNLGHQYQNDQGLYIDTANLLKHEGRITHNIHSTYKKENASYSLSIDNLFNSQYKDQSNRPAPGRLLSLNIQFQF